MQNGLLKMTAIELEIKTGEHADNAGKNVLRYIGSIRHESG